MLGLIFKQCWKRFKNKITLTLTSIIVELFYFLKEMKSWIVWLVIKPTTMPQKNKAVQRKAKKTLNLNQRKDPNLFHFFSYFGSQQHGNIFIYQIQNKKLNQIL